MRMNEHIDETYTPSVGGGDGDDGGGRKKRCACSRAAAGIRVFFLHARGCRSSKHVSARGGRRADISSASTVPRSKVRRSGELVRRARFRLY